MVCDMRGWMRMRSELIEAKVSVYYLRPAPLSFAPGRCRQDLEHRDLRGHGSVERVVDALANDGGLGPLCKAICPLVLHKGGDELRSFRPGG